jgi:exopolysaccharide production protein ExoY
MMNDLRSEPTRHALDALLSLGASGLVAGAPQPVSGDQDRALTGGGPLFAEASGDPRACRADGSDPLGGIPKRLTDIAVAVTGLLLAAPLMLIVALLIKLTDRGPIFFAHTRIGFNGEPFRCYKFRTMVADGDAVLEAHLAGDPAARAEWQETQKLRDDPRVGFLGRMLRKSSLDELPQLFNILRGDMSCVGPRPIIRAELERYGSAADYYLGTRPGLTGLWQVTGRSSTGYDHRVMLDTQYVRGWSLWADFVILCRTPIALTRFSQVS